MLCACWGPDCWNGPSCRYKPRCHFYHPEGGNVCVHGLICNCECDFVITTETEPFELIEMIEEVVQHLQLHVECVNKFTSKHYKQLQFYLKEIPLSAKKEVNLRKPGEMQKCQCNKCAIVQSAALALAVNHCQKRGFLNSTDLSVVQRIAVLKAYISVNLGSKNIKNVPSDMLSETVRHLDRLNLTETCLTTKQIVCVLEACISSPSLKHLNLGPKNLEEIPPKLLTQAASHLQKIDMSSTHRGETLSNELILAVLQASISSPTLLDVDLSWNNLKEIPCEHLSKAAHSLQRMNLSNTSLTSDQTLVVVDACVSSTMLEDLNLGDNYHFEKVTPELLKTAASKLHKLSLYSAHHSTEQCRAVLEACISSPTLSDVSFGNVHGEEINNYSGWGNIPPELLRKAASQLRSITVPYADWTIEQSTAVFEACIASSTLKELCLVEVQLWEITTESGHWDEYTDSSEVHIREVPKEILAEAVKCLDRIELTDSPGFLYSQLDTILEACISSKTEVYAFFHRFFEEEDLRNDVLTKAKEMSLFTYDQA